MAVITEEELERRRRLIETEALSRRGLNVDRWRTDEDGDIQAVFGHWFITEEGESDALFAGDEGVLTASVVGAPEHHNERVAFFFEGAEEVVPFTDVEPL